MQMVKRTQKTIKTQNKTWIINKNIPYTTQLLEGSSLVFVLSASFFLVIERKQASQCKNPNHIFTKTLSAVVVIYL